MAYPYYGAYPYYQPTQQPVQMQIPQQPVQPQLQTNTQGISTASRLVGNKEEANGVPADFSGSMMVFPDPAHDRVYVKRWNFNTGTADFAEYARVDIVEEPIVEKVVYAEKDYVKSLEERIAALEGKKTNAKKKAEVDSDE